MQLFGAAEWRLGKGIGMDSTALNELIAQVRGTAATLAEAEQRVNAFTAELAQQKLPEVSAALLRATPMPKRASFGWLPANK
jgi:ABC-type transporter Mla subunit MlaD